MRRVFDDGLGGARVVAYGCLGVLVLLAAPLVVLAVLLCW